MGKLSIKVVVGGRTYPLTVQEGEEEKVIKAAADINKAIKLLQDNYAVKDMQDLLAMTSLQLATKSSGIPKANESIAADFTAVEEELEALKKELNRLS